ncbi:MAG: AarF/ABC1/UbiB kinase family protein [Thermoanaerobaculia bacterium]
MTPRQPGPAEAAPAPEGPTAPRSRLSNRRRLLRVYRTVARLLLGYLGLSIRGIFRGPTSRESALRAWQLASARRVRRTLEEVQGLFIKVGQLISVLSQVLPAEFRAELAGLQDRVPSRPLEEIEDRLRRELGASSQELFASFDPQPLACASLAQVHSARLADGRRVAVKVQHRDIERLAELDLATIRNILRLVQWLLRVRGLDTAFAEVRQMILEELDFSQEAANIERIGAQFAAEPEVEVPRVVPERSTARVLTTTFMEGIKVTDLAALRAQGIEPRAVAERIVRAYCQMIFVDGLYHADPHPGNLLVRPDGGLVFLDFGAVSQLSPALKEGLPHLLEAVLKRDREAILRGLARMGFVPKNPATDAAERVIDYLYARFLEQIELESWNLKDLRFDTKMKLEVLADLSRLDIPLSELSAAFQVPKEWILLQRTLLLLTGLATELDPEMRPMAIIRPYVEEMVLGRERDWMGLASRAVKDLALSALSVPDDLRRLLAQARRGEARFEVRGLTESASLIYALGHQLLYGGFALGAGGFGYLAWTRGESRLALGLGAVSGLFLLFLSLSMLRARKLSRELRRRPLRR